MRRGVYDFRVRYSVYITGVDDAILKRGIKFESNGLNIKKTLLCAEGHTQNRKQNTTMTCVGCLLPVIIIPI